MAKPFNPATEMDLFAYNGVHLPELPAVEEESLGELNVVADFLCSTLVRRVAIRERGGLSYVQTAAWREPIKEYQIRALRILKSYMPRRFVDLVASDLADDIKKIHGDTAFNVIVPVPCGNSGRDDCFSVRLAVALGAKLNAASVHALSAKRSRGSSHPSHNRKWPHPTLNCQISGKVLLIDDVATSGTHISRSLQVLRGAGIDAFGLVWIGTK